MTFSIGDQVEKFAGDYGGPGRVVGLGKDESAKPWVAVSFKIDGGFGRFIHFLRPHQIRRRECDAVPQKRINIDYTNWRGERSVRTIQPLTICFESNEWHHETQWMLKAVDTEKGAIRTFPFANIHSFLP